MTPAEFRAMAREVMDNSTDLDPATVAEKIAGQLTDADCRDALAVTLPGWVRIYRADRDRSTRHATTSPTGKPRRSPRVDAIAQWHAAALDTTLLTEGGWQRLRDCTWKDLHWAATQRFVAAERNRREGDRWATLSKAMKRHRYATVADVPPDVLYSVLASDGAA